LVGSPSREAIGDRAGLPVRARLFEAVIGLQYCSYRWIGFSEDDAKLIAGGASRVWVCQRVEDNAFHRLTAMRNQAGTEL
jgi:hypothetical protein